jgi:hypothetical protein
LQPPSKRKLISAMAKMDPLCRFKPFRFIRIKNLQNIVD